MRRCVMRKVALLWGIFAAIWLSGCTTLHLHSTYSDIDGIHINHRQRGYVVKYAYDLTPPEVYIVRTKSESIAGVAIRAAARHLELTDFGRSDTRLETEYSKQVIGLTIKEGCSIAPEGNGSTKFFPVGNSSNKFIGTLRCLNRQD